MKLTVEQLPAYLSASLPMRGEWIEIQSMLTRWVLDTSLPMRGEWIEILSEEAAKREHVRSLPMRGEWIEIALPHKALTAQSVSPHAGRVD